MKFPAGQQFLHNMELIGYADLEGRPAFKLAIYNTGRRWYLYTAALWTPGLSITEITDPMHPRFVRFLPGPANTWTLQVQIAQGLMITSMEKIPPGWGGTPGMSNAEGILIWDLADPENPKILGHFKTGGAGTHRNYYDGGRYRRRAMMVTSYKLSTSGILRLQSKYRAGGVRASGSPVAKKVCRTAHCCTAALTFVAIALTCRIVRVAL